MMRKIKAAALALLLAGCAATGHRRDAVWPGAPADAFASPVSAFLQATYGPAGDGTAHDGAMPACAAPAQSSGQVQLAVVIADGTMQVVVMDVLGRRLATLTQRGRASTLRREPGTRDGFAGDELLTALQLTFWPLSALQATAAGTPWRIAGEHRRELWYHDRQLASVAPAEDAGPQRWTGRYSYIDCRQGLRIEFQSTAIDVPDRDLPTPPLPPAKYPP